MLGVLGVLGLLPSCGDGCRAVAPHQKSCGATFNMLPHSRPVLAFSRDLVRARVRARARGWGQGWGWGWG